MKRPKRRLPIPQWEFGFAPKTFNLIVETGIDGERLAREHKQEESARRLADKAQSSLFQIRKCSL
jgi:hypothetical protein